MTVTAEEQVLGTKSMWKGEEWLQSVPKGYMQGWALVRLRPLSVQVRLCWSFLFLQTVVPLCVYSGHIAFIHVSSFLCPTWVLGLAVFPWGVSELFCVHSRPESAFYLAADAPFGLVGHKLMCSGVQGWQKLERNMMRNCLAPEWICHDRSGRLRLFRLHKVT